MAVDLKQFERERVINMLKAFGWEMQSTSIDGDKLTITIVKTVKAEVPK